MTKTEASALREIWKQQVDPPVCRHLSLELESGDGPYLTGKYHCLVCGALIIV